MRASIIVATYFDEQLLEKTLDSVCADAAELDHELIVVYHEADNSLLKTKHRFPQHRFLSHIFNGPAPAKHFGACEAQGEILVFLDGHCQLERGALEMLISDVEEWEGRALLMPRLGNLHPELWAEWPGQSGCCQRLDLETMAQPEFSRLRHFRSHRRYFETAGFIGCGCAVARKTYFALRGFDADMQAWGSEDADLGLKAWLLGYVVLCDPQPIILHRFRAAMRASETPADVLANKFRMARKNLTDATWDDWLDRARVRHGEREFEAAWALFTARRASVEDERDYLFARRAHDEFWFAEHFYLPWPVRPPVPARQVAS